MLGQTKLLNSIDSFTLETFPKTSILVGDFGCGKHTLIKYISEKFNINTLELDDITEDNLNNLNISVLPYIYVINSNILDVKKQNMLLKTLEDPSNLSYIIIVTETLNTLINTLKNRCVIFKFDSYTKEELVGFIPDNYKNIDCITNICNTPGKLQQLTHVNFTAIYDLCVKLIDKLNVASMANTLTIKDKINYKDDYDKLDLNLMLATLKYLLSQKYIVTLNTYYLNFYNLTTKLQYNLYLNNYNKEQLVITYLIDIWKLSRGI